MREQDHLTPAAACEPAPVAEAAARALADGLLELPRQSLTVGLDATACANACAVPVPLL